MRRTGWVISTAVLAAVAVSVIVAAFPAVRDLVRDYRWWWILGLLIAVAAVMLLLLGTLLRRPWGSPWRARVLAAADALGYELETLPVGQTKPEQDLKLSIDEAVRHHLRMAREAAWPQPNQRLPVGQQFMDWWTGAPCEVAYLNLHEAEIAAAQVLPDEQIEAEIPEALARLQTMDASDPRRLAAEAQLRRDAPQSVRRAAFQTAVKIGLQLKDQQHSRLRSFRNVVLITALGLMILVFAVCLVGAWEPDALPICFGPPPASTAAGVPAPVEGPIGVACPSEEAPPTPGTVARRLPAPGDVTLVALLGVLGGGLSGAVAIRHLQGSSTPYDVPVALALLKLPSGGTLGADRTAVCPRRLRPRSVPAGQPAADPRLCVPLRYRSAIGHPPRRPASSGHPGEGAEQGAGYSQAGAVAAGTGARRGVAAGVADTRPARRMNPTTAGAGTGTRLEAWSIKPAAANWSV